MRKNVLRNCNGKRARVMKCLKITVIYFLMSFPLFAQNDVYKDWMIGPFEKLKPGDNPVMGDNFDTQFFCPMLGKQVRWEARAIIGGGTVVKDNRIYMIYHAEDVENGYKHRRGRSPGIMRMGLAWSDDGVRFERRPEPVLYPGHDEFQSFEWSGGCEIPRLIEAPDGTYVLHYNGWNRKTAHLMVATSKDLIHWTKHGSAFAKSGNAKYGPSFWSKSAAVVTEMKDGRLVAVKINGKYWMYFGEAGCMATSDNLIDWTVVDNPDGTPYTFLPKRPDRFDKGVREGGVAVRTEKGIVIIYNTFNTRKSVSGYDHIEASGLGQALADANDPMKLLDRSEVPFLVPDREYELEGAVNNVVFCTGIVYFKNRWYLYHNGGDRVLCVAVSGNENSLPDWALGGFVRPEGVNPVIVPDAKSRFYCPMQKKQVKWEESDVFNPAATVKDDRIQVLYRAEDNSATGIGKRTSRIGLAESVDGIRMKRRDKPVLFPAEDSAKEREWPGGCEDPRVAMTEDGLYVMMYTSWNRKVPRLSVATSRDLLTWEKHGPAFADAYNGRFRDMACKSGSIVTKISDGRQVITKVNGKYLMYWGEKMVAAAVSDDLIHWTPVLGADNELRGLIHPREGCFDSALTECGPPALMTDRGILLLYNGKNQTDGRRDLRFNAGTYSAGQVLFDLNDPYKAIARLGVPFFHPVADFEKSGQYVNGTVFIEGLVYYHQKWYLYYGCADSKVGVAICDPANPVGGDAIPNTY